jgi:hypothetical protein
MTDPDDAAERLLTKLRDFAGHLPADERQVLAALIGPGIELAHSEPAEVEGFDANWSSSRLPASLVDAVRGRDLRIEGW